MRALCVGRHRFLSDHLSLFFSNMGLSATSAVGVDGAIRAAHEQRPDIVLCDYDLLATLPLAAWEQDEFLSRIPIVAVSLTRRPDEVHVLDSNGIAGFLYLPMLDQATALRVLGALRPPVAAPYSLPELRRDEASAH